MYSPKVLLAGLALVILGVLAVTFALTHQAGYALAIGTSIGGALSLPSLKAMMGPDQPQATPAASPQDPAS